jgi:hypothetical protein
MTTSPAAADAPLDRPAPASASAPPPPSAAERDGGGAPLADEALRRLRIDHLEAMLRRLLNPRGGWDDIGDWL